MDNEDEILKFLNSIHKRNKGEKGFLSPHILTLLNCVILKEMFFKIPDMIILWMMLAMDDIVFR